MSIIIRLQNLPWSANSADIRHFFSGLDIPDGGVHILGGESGDAFIAFRNDEDARQAMLKDNQFLKENRIRLFLSSHVELEQLIEKVRKGPTPEQPVPIPENNQEHNRYRSPVHVYDRKSPERNIRRRSPDRSGRRRSSDRVSRRLSPDRSVRKRSVEKGSRRSPDRFNRRRSPNSYGRRRSRERSRRPVTSRRSRSPVTSRRSRSPVTSRRSRSPVTSRRSRSPLTRRHRSRSLDRQQRSHIHSDSQVERQPLPTRKNEQDIQNAYLDTSRNEREPFIAKEQFQDPENYHQNENFQRDVKFSDSTQLYERRSPTETSFPAGNIWEEPRFPVRTENLDTFNYEADRTMKRDLIAPRSHGESFTSTFFPHVQEVKDDSFNITKREFNICPPFQENSFPLNNASTAPCFNEFNGPPFQNSGFNQPPISRDPSRTVNAYKEEEQSNFSERFPVSSTSFYPQGTDRFPKNESRFPHQETWNESFPKMDFQDSHSNFARVEFEQGRGTNYNFNQNKPNDMMRATNRPPNYCLRMSGFGPNDTFKEVQSLLKAVYAPQKNIKWDVSNRGYKTGIAYVKICNEEDFYATLQTPVYFLKGDSIDVDKCPDEIYWKIFSRDDISVIYDDNCFKDFVYMLKGLPYSTTETDLVNFFKGLKFADLVILYDKNGKATGTGFVEFRNSNDFKTAFERNGKKIGHRYIELLKSNREDVNDAKKTAVSVSKPFQANAQVTDPQDKGFYESRTMSRPTISPKRPLCAFLSGLPSNIRNAQIYDFFSESGLKPHAVHILLNDMQRPSGKAYVEFLDFFDLDIALKQHGRTIGFNAVSIKQVLFEEMVNVLDTNQAIHAFENQSSRQRAASPIPEKVPYLWDPDEFKNTDENARTTLEYNNRPGSWRHCDSKNFNFKGKNENYRNEKPNVQVFDYSHHGNENYPVRDNQAQQFQNSPFVDKSLDEDMSINPACFSPTPSSPTYSQYCSPPICDDFPPSASRVGRGNTNRSPDVKPNQRIQDSNQFSQKRMEYENFAPAFTEEDDRIPVKFEMKVRQSVVTSTKVNDAFNNKTSEKEEKTKLSKLSPAKTDKKPIGHESTNTKSNKNTSKESFHSHKKSNESSSTTKKISSSRKSSDEKANQSKVSGRDSKSVSQKKNADEKKSSNDVAPRDSKRKPVAEKAKAGERKPDLKGKESIKIENKEKAVVPVKDQPKSRYRENKHQNKKDDKNLNEPKHDPFDILELGDIDDFEVVNSSCVSFGKEGCTVQATDIHPSVGVKELMDFFHGFNLRADDIIRRFTDFGVPTSDIRVAFRNSHEAQKALRTLNYKSLRGVPVKMVIV